MSPLAILPPTHNEIYFLFTLRIMLNFLRPLVEPKVLAIKKSLNQSLLLQTLLGNSELA